ncbi:MAG: lipid-A-disaccharide synthase [Ferruginibacter sp.]
MKYYLIAGEASGDLHGGNLIKELRLLDREADMRCWGGDKMEAAGATLVKHYRDLAFMGFIEVIKNLRTIFKNLNLCKKDILAYQPDTLILIDYPGFNLRIAKWARQQGLKIIYYISPQVWAWKENRVKMMKRCIDKMLVILPFEKDYYEKKWSWEVEYVGHPLVKVIEEFKQSGIPLITQNSTPNTQHNKIIALLPGSRKQEILKKLPVMLEVSREFPDYKFIVAKAPGLAEDFYNELLAPYENVSFVSNRTYDLLSQSTAALVTSGTATLETALFNVPEVICYKGSAVSYQIAKRLISIKYICLVNLIMDKEVVKELIQDQFNVTNLKYELKELLNNPAKQQQLKKDYAELKALLSKGGNASANAAVSIYNFLHKK